jgi:hypothetical protein
MASIFRWIISTIWTILIVPVLALVWHGVLDRGDVASRPLDWLMGWLASVGQIPGIYGSALVATGVLVGVWIDWFLKKIDGSRVARREFLGMKYCNLSNDVKARLDGPLGTVVRMHSRFKTSAYVRVHSCERVRVMDARG